MKMCGDVLLSEVAEQITSNFPTTAADTSVMKADLLRELAHLFAVEANHARSDEGGRLIAIADALFTRSRHADAVEATFDAVRNDEGDDELALSIAFVVESEFALRNLAVERRAFDAVEQSAEGQRRRVL